MSLVAEIIYWSRQNQNHSISLMLYRMFTFAKVNVEGAVAE